MIWLKEVKTRDVKAPVDAYERVFSHEFARFDDLKTIPGFLALNVYL